MIFIAALKALAYILVFILLITSIILFVPFRYKLNAGYQEKLDMHMKASWLWRIFTFIYDTDAAPAYKLRIFGRAGKTALKTGSAERRDDERKTKRNDDRKTKQDDDRKTKRNRKELGIKNTLKENFKENWRKAADYPYKNALINKTVLLTKRLLKALLPSQADGECHFGLDDPGTTGVLLGAAHTLLGITDLYNHIHISADFEKKILTMKCHIIGKITLWSLLWPFIAYTLSKPVWIIIKPLIFRRRTKG